MMQQDRKQTIMLFTFLNRPEPPAWPVYARLVAAAFLGLAWGNGPAWLLATAVVMPAVVLNARSRQGAFVHALIYFCLAARGLPSGAATFFGNDGTAVVVGFSLFLAAVVVNAAVWAAAWGQNRKVLRALAALTVTCLPPVGIIGWSHPLTSAGWLFPGLGLAGVALTAALAALLLANRKRFAGVLMVGAVATNAMATWLPTPNHLEFIGQNTEFGQADKVLHLVAAELEKKLASATAGQVLVLPESTLGRLDSARYEFLRTLQNSAKAKGVVVLVGAERADPARTEGYENGLVVLGEAKPRFIVQRVPVPVSMWQPWGNKGAAANLFGNGVELISSTKVATLICYEQLLTLPALMTAAHSPEVLLAPSSAWWAAGTSIPAIQKASALGWARLTHSKAVLAVNT